MHVSVIIPTYNSAGMIQKCLTGLENQSFPRENYEIIVIDDGSNDETGLIIRKYNVHYYFQENKGPATARNKGTELAKGDIVLFTDADCIPEYNWIEEMVSSLLDPEVVGVKGAYKNRQKSLWARFAQIEFCERYNLLMKKDYIDMIDTYSAGYKKDVFLAAGGFDTSFPVPNNEDTDLSYRLSVNGYKMVFNANAVVWHLGHPDSVIKYMRLKFWRGYWRMVVYQKYTSKIIKDSYTPQTLKLQVLLTFMLVLSTAFSVFFPLVAFYFISLWLFFFILASSPFIVLAFNTDTAIALLSPVFLFLRSLSLGSGVIYRLLKAF